MQVIEVDNVNGALIRGIKLLQEDAISVSPRGMKTLEARTPVTTVYNKPWQRVLLIPERDANPFFFFMEALWILNGRKDVEFLTRFNKRMAEFSDDGKVFHAAYGHRLRTGLGRVVPQDQLKLVVDLFRKDLDTRRAVLQIWNSSVDLNVDSKDIPCNDLIFLKVRDGRLNITVCNRSNDIIWGAYGANAVQFSILQEYLAAMIGVGMGTYSQVSDSFHAYVDNPLWGKLQDLGYADQPEYPDTHFDLVTCPSLFDAELECWFRNPVISGDYRNTVFSRVAAPMYRAWVAHKEDKTGWKYASDIAAPDWRAACLQWLYARGESNANR